MSGLVGFQSIWVSPPECLFGRFKLDLDSGGERMTIETILRKTIEGY